MVSPALEIFSKFAKVVDLPVKYDPNGSIFIEYWLASARYINNSEATHSQRCAVLNKRSFIVGPPVH
jgi:hypothetical protein